MSKPVIGFLGPDGTFTQQALEIYTQGTPQFSPKVGPSIDALFDWFNEGSCDEIIVPIENSIGGPVTHTMDLLMKSPKGKITHEILLPIRHCLLGDKACSSSELTHILSKDQAIMQCWSALKAKYPKATLCPVESTATAAEWISKPALRPPNLQNKTHTLAALGSATLAEKYNLHILDQDMIDNPLNQTRFVVISRPNKDLPEANKTSIVFSTHHQPGSLVQLLSIFDEANINLTHISSRPIPEEPGKYYFFIDFEGRSQDNGIRGVLRKCESQSTFFKCLGAYPKGRLND